VVGGLSALAFWSSRLNYSLLYGKLDEGEASKVIAALDEAKVPYEISRGGGAIMVPADKVYQVRMQMAGKGIPRGEGVGFEIFDKANFGISDFVQRANYTRAVQGELARTISQLDQVETARVMIVMPENRLLSDAQRKPTASVFVRVKGNGQLPSSAVNSIRFLVANSVEGLQANNVSVVDNMGNVLSQNEDNDSVGRSVQQPAHRPAQLRAISLQKSRGHVGKGPRPRPGRRPRLRRDQLGHHHAAPRRNMTRTARSPAPPPSTTRTPTPTPSTAAGGALRAMTAPDTNVPAEGATKTNAVAAAPLSTAAAPARKSVTSTYEINKITSERASRRPAD
jgi:flagellar M-ring protein FliF